MELHGSLIFNLQNALESSRRLRGHPVHRDTVVFWSELVREARARRVTEGYESNPPEERLIIELETAIAEIKADTNS